MEHELTDLGPPSAGCGGGVHFSHSQVLNGTPSIRGIFIDRFGTSFQPAAAAFIAAVVRLLEGKTVASENIW